MSLFLARVMSIYLSMFNRAQASNTLVCLAATQIMLISSYLLASTLTKEGQTFTVECRYLLIFVGLVWNAALYCGMQVFTVECSSVGGSFGLCVFGFTMFISLAMLVALARSKLSLSLK